MIPKYALPARISCWGLACLLYSMGSLKTQNPLVINNQGTLDGNTKSNSHYNSCRFKKQASQSIETTLWTGLCQLIFLPRSDNSLMESTFLKRPIAHARKNCLRLLIFKLRVFLMPELAKSFDHLATLRQWSFQSPYETGEVNPNGQKKQLGKPRERPFTLFISGIQPEKLAI